jgi:ferredoxin
MSHIAVSLPLGSRFFPEADAVTMQEYRRLVPDRPAPLRRRQVQRMACAHCGVLFTPHRLAANPRFCTDPCRRKFHDRLSRLRKKAAS